MTSSFFKLAWAVLDGSRRFPEFNRRYGNFISSLVYNSQLTPTNLVIALYYLYKYKQNSVLKHGFDDEDDNNFQIYLIAISLVLSNKSYDDQSYTLKTWVHIMNNTIKQTSSSMVIDLKLLNNLELYFLSALDFKLSYSNVANCTEFWDIFAATTVNPKIIQSMRNTMCTQPEVPVMANRTPTIGRSPIRYPMGHEILTPMKQIKHFNPIVMNQEQINPMAMNQEIKPMAMHINQEPPAHVVPMVPMMQYGPNMVCQLPPLQTPCLSSSPFSSACSPLTPLTPSYDNNNAHYGYPKRRRLYQGVQGVYKGYGNMQFKVAQFPMMMSTPMEQQYY